MQEAPPVMQQLTSLSHMQFHLKRPIWKKKPAPDPILLAELMKIRSLVHNLIAAASDLAEETVQRIVKHAGAINAPSIYRSRLRPQSIVWG
jgi:hypothetical protein